ncbi:MAG: CoA transferase, partial [Myxococcales bacterium]|nr:CoA transferase [Myxococcales bacterium]
WLFLVMIDSDRYWPLLARAIGRPELARDERFKGAIERFKNNRELAALLEEVFLARTLEAWGEALASERLIWAPVRTLVEASRDANAAKSGMFPTVEHPDYGVFRTVAPPVRMSAHEMTGGTAAPTLAADTAAVLAEAGVDDETIALIVASSS